MTWGNFVEVIWPSIKAWRDNTDDTTVEDAKCQAEKEADMPVYAESPVEGTFGDYNQLAIQFGYVTLFAPTYPMVVVLAFLSNLVEIR